MSKRSEHLHASADEQILALIELLSGADKDGLRRPCPGREKIGDGTFAAVAWHTADNFGRIAAFLNGRSDGGGGGSGDHHDTLYGVETIDVDLILAQLRDSRERLRRIAALTDDQLDAIAPKGAFRFADGERPGNGC